MPISKTAEIKNSSILSDDVDIKDGVKLTDVLLKGKEIRIDANVNLTCCKIFSNGPISIGKYTIIKERALINAFKSVSIGDRTIIDRDVFVGGMQSEKSKLEVGNDSVILYRSYLNTTRKISIGNNVGIGGYCLIFTHSSWPNVLHGGPYKFDTVEIKDNVWIPWNVTILPGVTIEENVIVGGGSIVTKSLPNNVFAAGVPAKIIGTKTKQNLSTDKKNSILIDILSDFHEYALDYLNLINKKYDNFQDIIIAFEKTRLIYTLNFKDVKITDTIISFSIPNELKKEYEWIELDTCISNISSEEAKQFIKFIRRYGIKIENN